MTSTQVRSSFVATRVSPNLGDLSEFAIEATNLSKTYGTIRAVDNISLAIGRGSIYAMLGPNGAGKTTTINMLTTLVTPGGGSARVAGFDVVRAAAEVRRRIGVTFQETVMDKGLSGRVLLEIHGRLYQLPKNVIKARVAELTRLVELEDAIDRPVKTYSGGMKRRLELARGLMTEPEVLFLDEPTLGLDPQNRDRIWSYIRQLKIERGLTILFTTHYMDEAEELADRVGIVDEGRIVAEDTPTNLISALGQDVVTVAGSGQTAAFVTALTAQSWVALASSVGQPSEAGQVQIGLKTQAGQVLRLIIELAERQGFAVADISIKRPSLNDVFLKHTGRRLRD